MSTTTTLLKKLVNAFDDLNEHWINAPEEVDEVLSMNSPFASCFNELTSDVHEWADECIDNLSNNKSDA